MILRSIEEHLAAGGVDALVAAVHDHPELSVDEARLALRRTADVAIHDARTGAEVGVLPVAARAATCAGADVYTVSRAGWLELRPEAADVAHRVASPGVVTALAAFREEPRPGAWRSDVTMRMIS